MGDDLQKLFTIGQCDNASLNLEWGQRLVPYLESALTHAGTYSSDEIQGHVKFFLDHIAPYLSHDGQTGYGPQYPSSMTNDQTPFELSLCWKSLKQDYKPIIRFITDIIPSNAENTRTASLSQSINLIGTLDRVSKESCAPTVHVLPELWRQISEVFLRHEVDVHPSGEECPRCGPSSTFVGFDLKASVISSKLYWLLPSCQSTEKALALLDTVFASCARLHNFFGSPIFLSSWGQICTHMQSNPDVLQPRMLSVDATSFPAPRIKIYTRCLFNEKKSFDEWEQHLNLDGAISYSHDFRTTACNLWTSLATNPEGWKQSRPKAGPKYCLVLYELTASSHSASTTTERYDLKSKLSSKLYIMCQEIPRKDSIIAKELLRHCQLAAKADILRTLADASAPTNFISEIGLAPREQGTEMSVYLNPSFFSRSTWEVAEDDYMTKCRITLPS
ncbi:aromatic prenyltransferases PTases of the DMATS/CymD familiy [Aspergillus parasiticus SU-1]|uniref:Aromatic prenyltransferases PTases of the DMATS/CymD familiy n=1 Tax=Aspergillus parasiticus (strain ATCC 56775 / NRRL 5862 / SRRC 143 / SU-1) TaxID=1403190 RepID=A0A0F0IIH0_ASPPU|nr:aromatic prenyltransferases PTases of the DMATS/CymD familiy [Aspergillus parasiticus SU-1]